MPKQNSIGKKYFLIFKISYNLFYFLLGMILLFIISFSLFYFVQKEQKIQETILANKMAEQAKKNDVYWRELGIKIFGDLKKMVAEKNQMTGIEAKEFQDDIGEGLSYLIKAKELNIKSYDNWLALARFYDFFIPYVAGFESDASEHYLYILKNFSADYDVKRHAVRVLIINSDKASQAGKNETSKSSLSIASELSKNLSQNDPVNLFGKYYEALIARRLKNYNFATSTLEQIKPFLNKEPDLYFELGMAYLETNQFEKAKINFETSSKMSDVYQKNCAIYLRMINEKMDKKATLKKRG